MPGEFQGQRSLADFSPWGHKEWDVTEQLTHTWLKAPGDPDTCTPGSQVLGAVFGRRALVQCWLSPFSPEATELPFLQGAIYHLGVFYSGKFLLIGSGLSPRAAGTDCRPSSPGWSSHVRTADLSSQSGPPQSMYPGPFSDLSAAFLWLQEHGAEGRGEGEP